VIKILQSNTGGDGKKTMDILLRTISLDNGLTINIYDRTKRYYEAFHLVKLEIVCEVLLLSDFFASESDFSTAKKLLGPSVVYRRTLEHMGVPAVELETAKTRLVQNFEQNSIPYFAAAHFPQKIVISEYTRAKKRLPSQQPDRNTRG
jgi:hypothetical protein